MKKFSLFIICALCLIGCTRTSAPDNRIGKIDMSKPVDYLVVKEEGKDKTLYILTGEGSEESENEVNTEETSGPEEDSSEETTEETE